MKPDAKVEDKARGKRLFGNLLGTLQKFKNDDKSSRTSEAVGTAIWREVHSLMWCQAKRREQVSERIASKLKSESTLHHDIAESERELKNLRIMTDSAEFVLKHKDAAVSNPESLLQHGVDDDRCPLDMLLYDRHQSSCILPFHFPLLRYLRFRY